MPNSVDKHTLTFYTGRVIRQALRRVQAKIAFGVLVRELDKQRIENSDYPTMHKTVAVAKRVASAAGINRDRANDRLWIAFHGPEL